ncbi:hypothetical protein HRI_005188700 [Hibiscus trionum]|uniref:Retrotransposon Copia-like N-terminal domain-containing protein n=1 Tax=Hibiscus trionum TaxID=183268 RepID=A0A9W7JJY4_HIBTR|nr:hypothetical protein HRI_005188700 [Hibiscus trionum]
MPNVVDDSEIDFNHPLFLHLSDTPGGILVSHRLVGIGSYNLWSRSMGIVLLAKNKLGFVDSSCKKEGYAESHHSQWERCNAFVFSWILNTVTSELSVGIVFASNAAQVWKDLKEQFDKVDGSRIVYLHREIATASQGDSSISTYFTRLRLLWDEYNSLVPVSVCDCDVSSQNSKHLAQQNLFQFLMGLNETYMAIRSQILLMQPLPTVNQAYSMLVQEESQQAQSSGISPLSDVTALYSNTSGSSDRRRFSGICDFFKICGHKRDSCYRLHGFPSDFKFTKKKGSSPVLAAHTHASTPVVESDSRSDSGSLSTPSFHPAPIFTRDQYYQLLQLLNKVPLAESTLISANSVGTVSQGISAFSGSWKDEGDW